MSPFSRRSRLTGGALTLAHSVLVALLAVACVADGPDLSGSGVERDPIIDGVTERGFLGVGALLIGSGTSGSLCTATAIAENWVLTAAHCIDGHDWREVGFFSGYDVSDGASGDYYMAGALVPHGLYRPSDNRHDIALVYVAGLDDVPTYTTNTPATPPTRSDVTWIGYGLNQTSPTEAGDGVKRRGDGDVDRVGTRVLEYDVEAGEAMPCRGDSGGPMFARIGGVDRIIGLVSTGDRLCEESGTDTRVDYYDEWIRTNMATEAPEPCDITGGDCGRDACWYAGGEDYLCFLTERVALGADCDPEEIDTTWPTVTCVDGATCVRTSTTDPHEGQCVAFCRGDGDCAEEESCDTPYFRGVSDVGVCLPEVLEECEDIRGGDCGPGTACWPSSGGALLCYPSDEISISRECNGDQSTWDELPCDDGMICWGGASDGRCRSFCYEDGDCRGDDECHLGIFPAPHGDIGYCGDCDDRDGDGSCAGDDCDDGDASAHPGASERCGDDVDNDCDGDVDEGCEECVDDDGDGYCDIDDCDDGDAEINPDAAEACDDGVDNDCDGATDGDDTDCGGSGDPDGGGPDGGDLDGGPEDPVDRGDGSGCSCSTTGAHSQSASATFLVLILAFGWRSARSKQRL